MDSCRQQCDNCHRNLILFAQQVCCWHLDIVKEQLTRILAFETELVQRFALDLRSQQR
jgi:hypothetical protein